MVAKIEAKHVFVSLTCFWILWLYTEVTEYFSRADFAHEVSHFMNEGGRNTSSMGYSLCKRIEHLEAEHHSVKGESCEKIYNVDRE